MIRGGGIETIVIGVSAIRLSAVGDLVNAQLAQNWGTTRDVIS
jgi:hypothetical protein